MLRTVYIRKKLPIKENKDLNLISSNTILIFLESIYLKDKSPKINKKLNNNEIKTIPIYCLLNLQNFL